MTAPQPQAAPGATPGQAVPVDDADKFGVAAFAANMGLEGNPVEAFDQWRRLSPHRRQKWREAGQAAIAAAAPELAALRELRAVAGRFADTWFELMVTLPDDYGCEMNCAEASAVADLYRALGMDDAARSIVAAHAATDDDEERASHDEPTGGAS